MVSGSYWAFVFRLFTPLVNVKLMGYAIEYSLFKINKLKQKQTGGRRLNPVIALLITSFAAPSYADVTNGRLLAELTRIIKPRRTEQKDSGKSVRNQKE
jgi:hypothetical protein